MSWLLRALNLLALGLGPLGFAGCLGVAVGVWIISVKLDAAAQNAGVVVDDALSDVRARLPEIRRRVDAAKITTQEIEATLKSWTKQEAIERIAERFEFDEKTSKLSLALSQADQWLATSEASLNIVQRLLSAFAPDGKPTDDHSLEALRGEVAALRTRLSEIDQFVTTVRQRALGEGDEPSVRERIKQAAQLAVRATATLGVIDAGLKQLDGRLARAQSNLQHLQSRLRRWILGAALAATAVAVWMAWGQISLCRMAWRQIHPNGKAAAASQRP